MPILFFGGNVLMERGVYYCRICKEWYSSYQQVCDHCAFTPHHTWCSRCELIFMSPEDLLQHQRAATIKHHICYYCRGRPDFKSFGHLKDHLNWDHAICGVCNIDFQTEENLKLHRAAQHGAHRVRASNALAGPSYNHGTIDDDAQCGPSASQPHGNCPSQGHDAQPST